MLAFDGVTAPGWMVERLAGTPAAGVTLFRHANTQSPAQLRELTAALQAAAARRGAGSLPLLVAGDQEGGQLIALGDGTTPFAGNMALGAAGDTKLAERVGRAIGLESRAVGLNVVYAPVCDIAANPANPAVGIRSFGEDPASVAGLAAAFVRGVQSAGAAATVKHFPGAGGLDLDSHHELGSLPDDHDLSRLDALELVPFRAAIEAGARVVMSGHFAVPGLTGRPNLPATLDRSVMTDLLRDDLGFDGVAITDALDMGAITQGPGPGQVLDAVAAFTAGVDLLLLGPGQDARRRIEEGLVHAAGRRILDRSGLERAAARLAALRAWLATSPQPDLGVVGSGGHRALARELAERSVTLVRDEAGLLPIRPSAETALLVVLPRPDDITPADTTSTVTNTLADALRRRHPRVEEILVAPRPDPLEIAALLSRAAAADLVILGTDAAHRRGEQAALAAALIAAGPPVVSLALRTPWDLASYPQAGTHACTYGIHPPQMEALAGALFGEIPFAGHLPVRIPGIATPAAGSGASRVGRAE